MTDSEQMWRTFGRAAALNPAQRHRWRLVEGELGELAELAGLRASGAAAAAPVVVDLGCGSGLLLSRLARALPGARRVGVDLAESALALARSQDGGIELVQADLEAEAPPLPASLEGHATAVVATELLEHLSHPERAVGLARRLCGAAARFVVTVPAGAMTPFDRAIGHQRHYTPASLRGLLESGGFRVQRVYRWG
ncbi:MAG TPA: class I SAM-dependent methyltransferase, partial [Polyangia bacterium]|nr:class I SAM-dependent methyltransferase [Polyangia bacterium]